MKLWHFILGFVCLIAINIHASEITHFSTPILQSSWCTYAGKVIIDDIQAVDHEDEVAVFVNDGDGGEICVGSCVIGEVLENYYYIKIYQDDTQTEIKDGALNDEQLIFKVWDKSTNKEYVISDMLTQEFPYPNITLPSVPPIYEDNETFAELNLSYTNEVITLEWYANSQAVSESSNAISLTAVLTKAYTANVFASYTVIGTATSGTDHSLTNGTLTLEAGQTSKSITITITDDTITELDETIIITMGTPTNAEPGSITIHTITIKASDLPTISWYKSDQIISESSNSATITATLSETNPITAVTIHFNITGTSNTSDHDAISGTLTIPSGNISVTKTILINDDDLTENNETLIFSIDTADNAEIGVTKTHTITINDNDIPTVNWSQSSQSISENAGTVSITANLNEANPRADVAIQYTINGTSGTSDHNAVSGTITIPSGSMTGSKTFSINDETLVELNETLIVYMDVVENANSGSITIHTVTINDDDVPKISLVVDDSYADEGISVSVFRVNLDQPNPRENIEISFQIEGSASNHTDFTITESPIIIEKGKTSETITITVIDDEEVEPNETVIANITNATNAENIASPKTITILDNDSPRVEWYTASQEVWENAGLITIIANLDKPSFQNITVSYIVSGSDHDLTPGTITVPKGLTSSNISFNILKEPACEADEYIQITITNAQNANIGAIPVHTILIRDICPDFDAGNDIVVLEDSGYSTTTAWAKNITTGLSDISSYTFIVTNNKNSLFSSQPEIAINGDLTFTPQTDKSGSAIVQVILKSNNYYVSQSVSFAITVLSVNDCPTFSMQSDEYSLDEDQDIQIIDNWISNINKGAPDESSQALSFFITETNSDIFSVEPYVTMDGKLRFKIKDNENGISVVNITLSDDGGIENNGCNSSEKSFTITVRPVNDPPVNIEIPKISGILQIDQSLSVNKGIWNDNLDKSPGSLNYSYQWEMADTVLGTNRTIIANEVNDSLILSSLLRDKFVRCVVTASDDGEGLPSTLSKSKTTNFAGPVKGLPVVSFVDNELRVNEEIGQVHVFVKLGRSSEVDVTLPYTITGTADSLDYTLLSDEPLVITKGYTKALILVNIIDDSDSEDNETIIIEFGDPLNAISGSISKYTITIKENDFTPEITNITPSESYAGGGINVTISGDKFVPGAEVLFDDLRAKSKVESKNKISCLVPSYSGILSQDTNIMVTVTNPGGKSDEITFSYIAMKSISGRVTANDVGIKNCLIEISYGYKTSRTITDENGYYTGNNLLSNDKYIVSAWPDKDFGCYNSQYYNGKNINNADYVSTVDGSLNNIDFSLEACANGRIIGRVHDGNGDAIDTGELLVVAFSDSLGESQFTIPEADGSYTIIGLKNANDYEVSVLWTEKSDTDFYYAIPASENPGEYEPAYSVIVNEDATLININNNQLTKIDIIIDTSITGSIEGNIFDCSGNPIANVFVFAISEALKVQKSSFTDLTGHFSINDLPIVDNADRATKGYIISAKKINYPTMYYGDTFNISEASKAITGETNINISNIGCGFIISGKITDESGNPVSMVPVLAKSSSHNSREASGTAYSNIKGDYSITSLMPLNDYIVYAVPMNYKEQYYNNKTELSEVDRVNISAGNQTGINFVLSEGPKLCGKITINGVTAKEGIPVNIWSESTRTGGTILTDSNGLYELRGLDPDAEDYIISVILSGYLPSFYHSSGTKYKWSEAEKLPPSSTCNKNINIIDGYSIFGRVTFDGNPVYTVFVEAYSEDGGWGLDTSRRIPGSNYNFIIKGLKPGNYEVNAEVKQECYSATPYNISITDQNIELDIELTNSCSSIFGTINNLNTDKTVSITAFSQSTQNYKKVSLTGHENSYSITNLKPASDYIVFMTSTDIPMQYYQNQTSWSDADYVDISTGDQTGIDFTMIVPVSISGELTFINGENGDKAFVIASSKSTNKTENAQVIYPDTQYTLTVKPASDYIVSVMSFKYKATPVEQIVDASSDVTDINFELTSGAEISGHIYNENGLPISGITVEAWSDSIGVWSGGITDNTGSYTIKGLKTANDYIVYVDDPTKSNFYYSTDGTVKNKSNASYVSVVNGNVNNIDISFFAVQNISGTVMDENGKALSGIWVYAWSETEQSGNGCKTDTDGTFVISGLAPAIDYYIEAIPNRISPYRNDKKPNISSGSSNIIFMLMQGYTLSGTVTNNDGDPLSKIIVEIRSITEDFYGRSKTDSQGSYEIKGIVSASDYKIMVTSSGDDSYIPIKESIAIVNDMTKNINLVPGFKLSGYVKKDGTGVKDVTVMIISISNDFFSQEVTDSWGYYEVNNVPAGSDYQITAKPINYAQQTQVDQTAGTEVNFNLSSGGPVSGYVRDASFNPLSGVRVKLSSSYLNNSIGTTTNTDGYYIFNGLQKYDLSGNYIADYVITVSSSDYPIQEETNIKVDDTVNFTMVSSDNNKLSGVVTDSSGSIPPLTQYVYVYLFKEQTKGGQVAMMKTDENGQFEFTGLQSDQTYQLRFKILKGSNKNVKFWSGINGPNSNRANAKGYLPGNNVNFQFDVAW